MMTSKALLALFAGLLLPAVSIGQERVQGGTYELKMEIDDRGLRVSGGAPFNPCGIMLGLEEGYFVLPGNALLSIKPLLMLTIGSFDENGEYEFDLEPLIAKLTEPLLVFAQAITIVEDSEFFETSNVLMLGMLNDRDQGARVQDVDGDDDGHQDRDHDGDWIQPHKTDGDVSTAPVLKDDDKNTAAKTHRIDDDGDTKPVDTDEPPSVRTQPVDTAADTKPTHG